MEPIKFVAQVARVQTLADGGLRVVLDLPGRAVSLTSDDEETPL
jgi:hypothetical protein